MAGLAYVYQGNVISFDDEKYIDPEFGTAKFLMNVSGKTHHHGFTSDVSASEYCPLQFNVGSTPARIGMVRTRSRMSSEESHTEEWSGTGYVATTGTVEEVIGDQTAYSGAYTSQGTTSRYYTTLSALQSQATYRTSMIEEEQYGTTSSAVQTTSTSERQVYESVTKDATLGYVVHYRSELNTLTSHKYTNSTLTTQEDVISFTKISSATRTDTNGYRQSYASTYRSTGCYTYGEFDTFIIPQHTLTHTATYETLHNLNL